VTPARKKIKKKKKEKKEKKRKKKKRKKTLIKLKKRQKEEITYISINFIYGVECLILQPNKKYVKVHFIQFQ
jgi:hypothetical protein